MRAKRKNYCLKMYGYQQIYFLILFDQGVSMLIFFFSSDNEMLRKCLSSQMEII